jgi:hypothetical protein
MTFSTHIQNPVICLLISYLLVLSLLLIPSKEWSYDHAFHVEIDALMYARQIGK